MRSNFVRTAVLLSLVVAGIARAEEGDRQGLYFTGEDSAVPAPVLGSTIEVRVTGIVARTRVTQIFMNPAQKWMEGVYIFPLPEDAAVDTLRLKIGERTSEGIIQEKQEARHTYEAAKQQGAKASLLEQQRPDIFTTMVANIGPGETVEVAIEMQQAVRFEKGRFALRFPMVVAPRPESSARRNGSRLRLPPVLPRGSAPVNPFAFHADLNPGFPLATVKSPTHPIVVAKGETLRYAVDLADGAAPADGDLVLEWTPAVGREPRAVFYTEEVDGEHYALLMVMPPDAPAAAASRLPRESIFIIDTSGSMSGSSIEQAREALRFALDRLQPSDGFNVVQFNSTASALFPDTVPATPARLEQARRYVRSLGANGDTRIRPALEIGLKESTAAGLVRQVIFVTDGQVEPADERFCFCYLKNHLGDRRLFTVAIGSAPNVSFLRRMADLGRGSFTQIPSVATVAEGMRTLFAQLEAPMLHQIEVSWNDPAVEAWPSRVPDLYLGEPLVVAARRSDAKGPVKVSGARGGDAWEDSFPAAAEVKGAGIDKLWARRKIQALTDSLVEGASATEVRRAVTELGLRHHLVTDHTNLVAVDEAATAPPEAYLITRVVPVNAPVDISVATVPVEEVITVTAESPLLDERRISTGATIIATDLETVPTARDPWAVLPNVPGVMTDKLNTGGNESGQQMVDGVVVTGLAALGASPAAYDFDAFEEMQLALPEDEARRLCAVIQEHGWDGLTLESALAAAPSLADLLRHAETAGLLRGFAALVIQGKGCSEPPPEVLAESRQYIHRFGAVRGQG